ncbi:MAG TPA: hypothetical protein VMV46_07505 [Thermoanaerobaculia bacterium]|nr:hypothetical protein [Thermoanaerobaculia bacterium]
MFDTCDGTGTCVSGMQKDCNDADACTIDSCNPIDGVCAHEPITICQGGDGCCPAGCSEGNDSDCSP